MKKLLVTSLFFISVFCLGTAFSATSASSSGSSIVFTASLNAVQESLTDTSMGTATAYAILSSDRTELTYQITYAQLTSKFSAAHFHLGAPGINGGAVEPITSFAGNTASGVWKNIPDSLVGELLKGNIYINIHTTNYPGGEIRGQLTPVNGVAFFTNINAAQVNSADTSMATGTGWAVLTDSASIPSLNYAITIAGLTSQFTNAHFHLGAPGVSGGVVEPIFSAFHDSTASGVWSNIPDSDLLSLLKGDLYVNVHSTAYPAGEIRGQVELMKPISFYATLNGSQEVPPVNTNATATAWFVLNNDSSSLSYQLTYANLQGPFTAAHFHLGALGVGGGVVEPISSSSFVGNTASGTWSNIPDSLLVDLVKDGLYVNIHSSAHPGGEIRGQVMLNEGVALMASLNGQQDVPQIVTAASGTAALTFINDTLKYQITVAGLSSAITGAHFHLGASGTNGGVIEPIIYSDSTTASFWTNIDDATLAQLVKGNVYLNVHSSLHPGGEIRGQVVTADYNNFVTGIANQNSSASVPSSFELKQNYPNPFNPTTTIDFSISNFSLVTLKVYDILGREVATLVNGQKPAGNYHVEFNGSNLASGVYLYALQAGNYSAVKKLILLK